MPVKMFSDRIAKMTDSIFSTMSKLAFEHNAVNLGQGFPDLDGPPSIPENAYKAMLEGRNQYAPSPGTNGLRREISSAYKIQYDREIDPNSEITITAGATEALYSTTQALLDPGDEVIVFEPFYDAYTADVVLAGAAPVFVTLKKPDFRFDPEDLEKVVTQKTKMIIVNNPHNPTGKVFTQKELETIADFAISRDLFVLSDEVYEFLTYDEARHVPIATLPGMKDRTITICSTGKTFGMTGWKIGFAIAEEEITRAIRKVHQWTTFAVNTPGQYAMARAFADLENYLPEFRKLYQSKRDLMTRELDKTDFKYHIPKGSYFIMVDIPGGKAADDVEAAKRLVEKCGVATIPPSVFYERSDEGKTMLRLCFAKSDETIIQGAARLNKF